MPKINKATSEATQYQAQWLARNHPEVAASLEAELKQMGVTRKQEKSRSSSGFLYLADMLRSARTPKLSPLDALLSGGAPEKATISKEEDIDLSDLDVTETNADTRATTRFLNSLRAKAWERVQEMHKVACTATSMDSVARPPEVVTFEGKKAILVHSVSIHLFGRELKHDFTANDIAVKNDHPSLVDQLIRSLGDPKDVRVGKPAYYVKALHYKDGMIFRGYFNEKGRGDVKEATCYYVVRGDEVQRISKEEYNGLSRQLRSFN